jgi:Tol biopolymer transport system component
VAFWGVTEGAQRDIWTVPAAGPGAGSRVSVTSDAATDWYPRWSADGRWLYFLSDRGGVMNLWRVPIDEASGRVLGEAESVVAPALALSGITFARGGQMAYATSEHRSTIERLTLDPVGEHIVGSPNVVLRDSRQIAFVEWSPHAEWLSFSTTGTRENIFLVRPDGSGYRQVTDDAFRNRGAVWSPDGTAIAFFSNRSGRYQVWSVRADGSGLRQLSNAPEGLSTPIWSPTGDMLAVTSTRTSRGWSLYDVREGKLMDTPQRLDPMSAATYFLPMTWSADGSSIAGVQMEAGRSAGEQGQKFPVFLYSVRDRTYRPVSASGGVLWMSDSRRLLVYDNTEIAIVDTETGRRKSLLTGLDRQAFNQFWRVSLSRDDRHIAVVTDDAEGNLWMLQGR